jgi:hypothetical protein
MGTVCGVFCCTPLVYSSYKMFSFFLLSLFTYIKRKPFLICVFGAFGSIFTPLLVFRPIVSFFDACTLLTLCSDLLLLIRIFEEEFVPFVHMHKRDKFILACLYLVQKKIQC